MAGSTAPLIAGTRPRIGIAMKVWGRPACNVVTPQGGEHHRDHAADRGAPKRVPEYKVARVDAAIEAMVSVPYGEAH